GWMPFYAIDQSTNEFRRGNYKKILTSGGQATGQGSYEHGVTYAILAAQELRHIDFDANFVEIVSAPVVVKDRTYHSALAVKKWLNDHHLHPASIDVMTLGPHARRSRLLFQEAMGKDIKVGVICVPNTEYDE